MLDLILPLKPQAKERPRVVKGRAYTPQSTRSFEESIRTLTAHLSPITTPIAIRVVFIYPRLKSTPLKQSERRYKHTRPDIDNLLKALLDGCQGTVFVDDSQIVHLTSAKMYAGLGEEECIEISVLDPANPYISKTARREQNQLIHRQNTIQKQKQAKQQRKERRQANRQEIERLRSLEKLEKKKQSQERLQKLMDGFCR